MISGAPEPGWKTIQLDQVLTAAQINEVLEILRETSYPKRIGALKAFAYSIEKQLDQKSLLPEFFAYWMEFAHIKGEL